jgi:hypothetical protein
MVGELLAVPTDADAEEKPAFAEDVERRGLTREIEQVVLEDEGDCGPQDQPCRRARSRCQRDQRTHHVDVPIRQRLSRDRTLHRGGDVAVLWHPHRLEVALFELDREPGRCNPGARVHRQIPELHDGCPLDCTTGAACDCGTMPPVLVDQWRSLRSPGQAGPGSCDPFHWLTTGR